MINISFDPSQIVPQDKIRDALKEFLTVIGLPEVSRKPDNLPFPVYRYNHPRDEYDLESIDKILMDGAPIIQEMEIIRQYNGDEDDDDEFEHPKVDKDYPRILTILVEDVCCKESNTLVGGLISLLMSPGDVEEREGGQEYQLRYPSMQEIEIFKQGEPGASTHAPRIGSNTTSPEEEITLSNTFAVLGIYPVYLLRFEEAPEFFTLNTSCVDVVRVNLSMIQEQYSMHHKACEGRSFLKIGQHIFDLTMCQAFISLNYFGDRSKKNTTRTDALPTNSLPTDSLPNESLPTDSLPTDSLPNESLPTDSEMDGQFLAAEKVRLSDLGIAEAETSTLLDLARFAGESISILTRPIGKGDKNETTGVVIQDGHVVQLRLTTPKWTIPPPDSAYDKQVADARLAFFKKTIPSSLVLPASIGNFSELKILRLDFSRFGPSLKFLPETIGNLVQLEDLYIDSESLHSLPRTIGNFQAIRRVEIKSYLQSLPDEIGNWQQLDELRLKISAETIPESIGKLTKLKHFKLWDDHLTTLPDTIENLVSLRFFDLQVGTRFSFPEAFARIASLQYLTIYVDQVEYFPRSLRGLTSLKQFELATNRFPGPFSFLLPIHLEILNMSVIRLKTIPESMFEVQSLVDVNLWNNRIEVLPAAIGNLTRLKKLNIRGNFIEILPDTIGQLRSLTYLDISGNQITRLPKSIGQLKNLVHLDIGINRIDRLPDTIINLTLLEYFDCPRQTLEASSSNVKDWIETLRNKRCVVKLNLLNWDAGDPNR